MAYVDSHNNTYILMYSTKYMHNIMINIKQ